MSLYWRTQRFPKMITPRWLLHTLFFWECGATKIFCWSNPCQAGQSNRRVRVFFPLSLHPFWPFVAVVTQNKSSPLSLMRSSSFLWLLHTLIRRVGLDFRVLIIFLWYSCSSWSCWDREGAALRRRSWAAETEGSGLVLLPAGLDWTQGFCGSSALMVGLVSKWFSAWKKGIWPTLVGPGSLSRAWCRKISLRLRVNALSWHWKGSIGVFPRTAGISVGWWCGGCSSSSWPHRTFVVWAVNNYLMTE